MPAPSLNSAGRQARAVDAGKVDARRVGALKVDANGVDASGVDARGIDARGIDPRLRGAISPLHGYEASLPSKPWPSGRVTRATMSLFRHD